MERKSFSEVGRAECEDARWRHNPSQENKRIFSGCRDSERKRIAVAGGGWKTGGKLPSEHAAR